MEYQQQNVSEVTDSEGIVNEEVENLSQHASRHSLPNVTTQLHSLQPIQTLQPIQPHHHIPSDHPLSHPMDSAQLQQLQQHAIQLQYQHVNSFPTHYSTLHTLQHHDFDSSQLQHQMVDPRFQALHSQLDHNSHFQQTDISQLEQDSINTVSHEVPIDTHALSTLGKKRKHTEKTGHMNTCLALGCERQIKQRRLCPMHQKQKERNGGKIELKENVKFTKGRTPTPFSKHANKYAKLKTFDKKIDEWAGGKEEGTLMLDAYLESSYHQNRFPKQEDSKIYEQIGKNIVEFMKQLPEKSPLRRPLIKAMSDGVPLARLREVLPVSKQTVINSKKLSDQDNLLLTIKYKPNVTRNRKRNSNGLDINSLSPSHSPALSLNNQLQGVNNEEPIVNAVVANDDLSNYSSSIGQLTNSIH